MTAPARAPMASGDRLAVLALVPALVDTSPGQRFRLEQWAPRLADRGIDVEFRPFETAGLRRVLYTRGHWAAKLGAILRGLRRRAADVRRARAYDVVYVFRETALLGPALVERSLARAGVPYVFDFDDAVFEPYISPSNSYLSFLKFPGKTRTACRLASHVIAGNPYLASWARRHNSRVSVVPTTIDVQRYRPRTGPAEPGVPVIGWSGSHSTTQHLKLLDRVLPIVAARRRFRLLAIGASDYTLPGVDVETRPWAAETEMRDLLRFDVGVMPLPDDRWSRGKCGLKALQYMALGVPAVCSPVGVNADIIAHGRNGLLASSDQEWVEALVRLLDEAPLRQALGRAGRQTVVDRYSADAHVPAVAGILREAAARR